MVDIACTNVASVASSTGMGATVTAIEVGLAVRLRDMGSSTRRTARSATKLCIAKVQIVILWELVIKLVKQVVIQMRCAQRNIHSNWSREWWHWVRLVIMAGVRIRSMK